MPVVYLLSSAPVKLWQDGTVEMCFVIIIVNNLLFDYILAIWLDTIGHEDIEEKKITENMGCKLQWTSWWWTCFGMKLHFPLVVAETGRLSH